MRIRPFLLMTLAGTLLAGGALATTITKLSLGEISRRATVAVVGEVSEVRTAQTASGIYTLATVKVEQAMWGTQATSVVVALPGGAIRNSKITGSYSYPGMLRLMKGMRAVFMLGEASASTTNGYAIVGLDQGVFPVLRTAQGDAVMLPGNSTASTMSAVSSQLRDARALPATEFAN